MVENEGRDEGGEQGGEEGGYSHDALAFLFLKMFPDRAARWVGARSDLPYDVQRVKYKLPVVEREGDCVFFLPENVPEPTLFWEVYNYRNDLAIRNLLGKAGVISEQVGERVHSALPILWVMRESQIPNDPGFLDYDAVRLLVHERMLRESPDDPYVRLMGLTYSPKNYVKDHWEAMETMDSVRRSEGDLEAAKASDFIMTLFLNKYRDMDRIRILEDLGQIEGLVDPMEVPWARSFYEEGFDKGREEGFDKGVDTGAEKERRKFIKILAQRGTSADEIAQILEVSDEYVQRVLLEENA